MGFNYTDEEDALILDSARRNQTPNGTNWHAVVQDLKDAGYDRTLQGIEKHYFRFLAKSERPLGIPENQSDVAQLREQVARLEDQLKWFSRSDIDDREGGKATLAISDTHIGDRAHMLSCFANLQDKVVKWISKIKPDRLIVVLNGDIVSGRGIFRGQERNNVFQLTTDQVAAGTYRLWELDQDLKRVVGNVEYLVIEGTHDRNFGEPIAPHLVLSLRLFGMQATFCGTQHIASLSDVGTHNCYFEHGYGYSGFGPASNKFVYETTQKLLVMSQRYYGAERIYRLCHGHGHWLDIGFQRTLGMHWDSTGGLQRNDRVEIGKNQRPIGFVLYHSPKNQSDITRPIEIEADDKVLFPELNSSKLYTDNQRAASIWLDRYNDKCEQLGLVSRMEFYGEPPEESGDLSGPLNGVPRSD